MTTPLLPHGGRWDCGGCTACCRHFSLGPVSDDIVQGLENKGIRQQWAPAADGFATRRPGPDGDAWFFGRRDDGACIFLQSDGFCAIHARWGAEAKPAFCREYPFASVRDGEALRMYVRADCGGWAASFDSGTPIADQAAAVAALDHQHPIGRFAMDPVPILPGVGIDPSQWEAVESHLLPLFEADEVPVAALIRTVGERLADMVGRPLPPPDPIQIDAVIEHVAASVEAALAPAVAQPPADDVETIGMIAFLAEVLALVRAGAERPDRPLSEQARRYVGLVLRSQLHGRAFQSLGGLPGWLGVMLVGVRLAARACPGEGSVSAIEVGERLATWVRLTRHDAARQLLGDLRPALDQVLLRAG